MQIMETADILPDRIDWDDDNERARLMRGPQLETHIIPFITYKLARYLYS